MATLEGRASLPPDTFAPGPPSGGKIGEDALNGRELPFDEQPVQGISAVLDAGGGAYWAMPDNGYGTQENSSDFLLRVYRLRPGFETGRVGSGAGDMIVEDFIELRDPDSKLPFAITNEDTSERLLTGADLDPESMRRDGRGDLWFGDEFGPFLLHTDPSGRVLEAPFSLPSLRAPEHPNVDVLEATRLQSSRGFEGMGVSESGRFLYPMLEGALNGDLRQRRRFIYEFDTGEKRFTQNRWQYQTEDAAHAIGEVTSLDDHRMLVIERDDLGTREARFKKVYLIDLRDVDASGYVRKEEVLDLLNIRNPQGIAASYAGDGDVFSFPFQNVESILTVGREDERVLVMNDNNYPFSLHGTEAIVVRLAKLSGAT